MIDGEVARNVGPHRSRDKWNEAEEQERSGAKGKDSFWCDHIISFLSSEFEMIRILNRKRSAVEARNMRLRLVIRFQRSVNSCQIAAAITDNTKDRNHLKEEEDDLNPALLALSYASVPQNSIRLHPGNPR